MEENRKRELAWIGDAVLGLFARKWILQQPDIPAEERTDIFIRLTSNRFLSTFGEPTEIEAKIGERYDREGLESAFSWMEDHLLPVFRKNLLNRSKANRGRKIRKSDRT